MFAHQAIQCLRRMGPHMIDQGMAQTSMDAADTIESSVHFHLGVMQELETAFTGIIERKATLFMDECAEDVRLPYQKCWMDLICSQETVPPGQIRSTKRGVVVTELALNVLHVRTLAYFNPFKVWGVGPYHYLIGIGITIAEIPHVREYVKKLCSVPLKDPQTCLESNLFPMPSFTNLERARQFIATGTANQMFHEDAQELSALNMALMLLGCKNIVTETVEPAPKLNKARKKKDKVPVASYRVLRLVLPQSRSARADAPESKKKGVSLHLVHGHFKTYGKDAPLFGRITGRFWWQPSLRGKKSKGVVTKDYSITPAS